MMKRTPLFSLFICLFVCIACKEDPVVDPSTSSDRFTRDVFSRVQATKAVQFGEAVTLGGNNKSLFMDIYEPEGDQLEKRPIIILAFGGAFLFGEREELADVCLDFAKKGYVAATIDYRLIDGLVTDSIDLAEVLVMASNDMRAAIRFFREDAATDNAFRIDPNLIFIGGVSAGAIVAIQTAALDPSDEIPEFLQAQIEKHGGFEGNSSQNTQYSSVVQGVLSYSGSIYRNNWIDAQTPPIYFVHEEFDPVVPCGYGRTSVFSFAAFGYGACEMKARADEVGIDAKIFIVRMISNHVSYLQLPNYRRVLNESAGFLKKIFD